MRTKQYRELEKAAAAHDKGGIWERWRYGRLLLVDDTATTPQGNLRNGVLDKLIEASAKDGLTLERQEIQRRIRAGKRYPTEAQLRTVGTQYESWRELREAGFPEVPAPDGAVPYDPRKTDDLVEQHDRRGADLLEKAVQGSLFPQDADTTLAEIARWLDEQDEITRRFADLSVQRREQFAELVKAVDGDLTKTLAEARLVLEAASDLDDDEVTSG